MARQTRPRLHAEDSPTRDARGRTKLRSAANAPGTDHSDPDPSPPEEPGVSIEPTEIGVQFLRDATEQDNFESHLQLDADRDDPGAPLDQMLSDATLESASQSEVPLPFSESLSEDEAEIGDEPREELVDMTDDAIRAGSLFDQPLSAEEEEADEDEDALADDDFSAAVAAPLRAPRVASDDPSDVDDERQRAIQQELDERVKRRLHRNELPGEAARTGRR